MDSPKTFNLSMASKAVCMAVLLAAVAMLPLGATAAAQTADIDVALTVGDQTLTDSKSITADPGQEVVIEFYASGWDGQQGVEGVFDFSSVEAVDESSIQLTGTNLYSFALIGGSLKAGTGNAVNASLATFTAPPSETGTAPAFLGSLKFTLASSFTTLEVTLSRVNYGDGTGIDVSSTVTIINSGSIPRTLAADLDPDDLNSEKTQGRYNPGEFATVQLFGSGLRNLVGYEVTAQVEGNFNLNATNFVARAPFTVTPAGGASELPAAVASTNPQGGADVQFATGGGQGDRTFSGQNVTLTADAGARVAIEFYGTGVEDVSGFTARMTASNITAIKSVTPVVSSLFPISLPGATRKEGDQVITQLGFIGSQDLTDTAPQLLGTVILELAANFNGVSLSLPQITFSGASTTPIQTSQVINILPVGGIKAPIVTVSGNTVTAKASAQTGVEGSSIRLGRFGFRTSSTFRGGRVTITKMVFIPGGEEGPGSPITIEPNIVLNLATGISDAPVVTQPPAPTTVTDTEAIIRWATNKPGSGTVLYGTDPANLDRQEGVDALVNFHRVRLTGLTAGTKYYFQVVMTDNQGRTSDAFPSRPSFFVTRRGVDLNPPQVLKGPTPVGLRPTGVRIAIALDEAATVQINYGTAQDALTESVSSSAAQIVHELTLTGLTGGTQYLYQGILTDLAGNSRTSSIRAFRTPVGEDTQAPRVLRRPGVLGVTSSSALITWTTNENSSSAVFYGTVEDNPTDSAVVGDLVIDHKVGISNLPADTTVYYQVRSIDASGNTFMTGFDRFRTKTGDDTVPPQFIGRPVVTKRSNNEALIEFRTDEATTATVQYDTLETVADDETGVLGDFATAATPTRRHEVRLTNLEAGKLYYYQVSITDVSGNGPAYDPGSYRFATKVLPDTKAPVVFRRPAALGVTQESAIITWGADEPHSAVIRYRVAAAGKQGEEYTDSIEDPEVITDHAKPITGLTAGTVYEYEVETTDSDGNTSTSRNLRFRTKAGQDTRPPTIVRGPRVGQITASSATIVWSTDEPADTRVSYGATRLYGETVEISESATEHSVTLTGLEASTRYHFAVGSADQNGNVITTDASGRILGVTRDHVFRTLAADDTQAPVILRGPTARARSNDRAVVTWITDERASSTVFVGVDPGSDAASVEGTPVLGEISQIVVEDNRQLRGHVVVVTGLEGGVEYKFQVASTDAAGNTVTSSLSGGAGKLQPPGGFGSFTTSTEADTQFPVITSGPTVVSATKQTVIVEWATDESANSVVSFGTSESDLSSEETSPNVETNHRMVLTKLSAATTYAYQVSATDASGNGATKSVVAFATTAGEDDLVAPVISSDPEIIYLSDRQASISWSTNEATDGTVSYGTSSDNLASTTNDPDFNTTHSITLTNLDPATEYFYRVESTDQNNNGPTQSSVLSFTTEAAPDLTAPTISSVASAASDSSAVISWTTNELSDSAVRFGFASGALDLNEGTSDDVLFHTVTLTNLDPNTTYTYKVQSIDRAGNGPAESGEATFTTLSSGEAPVPDAPTELSAIGGNGAVQLLWTASPSTGVTGNIIERAEGDGSFTQLAQVGTSAQYLDLNVTNDTEYSYQVRSLGLKQTQSEAAASGAVTPTDSGGPSQPVLFVKQGSPLSPTFVVSNSEGLSDGDNLTYTFHLASIDDFSDAIDVSSGVSEGSGIGVSDPSGITAFTVNNPLTDGETYYYRIKASDGTFDSPYLTGNFTVNAAEPERPGDIDGDFGVSFGDFVQFVQAFGKSSGDAGYNAQADLDGDGSASFADFVKFVQSFGLTFIQGEDGSSKPVAPAPFGIDATSRFQLVSRPVSTEAGAELIVDVRTADVSDLRGLGFRLDYDPDVLEFVEVRKAEGGLLTSEDRQAETFGPLQIDPVKGEVFIAGAITDGATVEGEGAVATVRFRLLADHPQGDLMNIAEGFLFDGKFNINAAQNLGARLSLMPDAFSLERNFPNPFNPETTIRYSVPDAGRVSLVIYNILGQEIATLTDRHHLPGFYAVRWDGRDRIGRQVASGVYMYRINAVTETDQRFTAIHKMLLLK